MARTGRPPLGLQLSAAEQSELLARLRARSGDADEKFRIRIILALAGGESSSVIAKRFGTTVQTVSKWRRRFEMFRFSGLVDALRAGRGRRLSDEQVQDVIDRVRGSKSGHSGHWSVRQTSKATGVSATSVHRILRALVQESDVQEAFGLSTDLHLVGRDVVGLYLSPPDRALVLCVDEKRQIQTLSRTQRGSPLSFSKAKTRAHEHKRDGTTSLFAALDAATLKAIGQLKRRHRVAEFLQFLDAVDATVPLDRDVYLFLDNRGVRAADAFHAWIAAHSRYHVHFTPTSASWLSLLERCLPTLGEKSLKGNADASVKELERSIRDYLASCSEKPKPFMWHRRVGHIAHTVGRAAGEMA